MNISRLGLPNPHKCKECGTKKPVNGFRAIPLDPRKSVSKGNARIVCYPCYMTADYANRHR